MQFLSVLCGEARGIDININVDFKQSFERPVLLSHQFKSLGIFLSRKYLILEPG